MFAGPAISRRLTVSEPVSRAAVCATWRTGARRPGARATRTPESVDASLLALPIGGAQVALEHLQRARKWQRLGPELDRLRHLEPRDPLAGVRRELIFRRGSVGFEHNDRVD